MSIVPEDCFYFTHMSRVVHAIFEPAHVFWGTCLHFRPTKTQASLCRLVLAFVTNIHKVWMKIKTQNKIWTPSPTRCVESRIVHHQFKGVTGQNFYKMMYFCP